MSQLTHIWKHNPSQVNSNDVAAFTRQWRQQAARWNLTERVLGEVDGEPLTLYRSANDDIALPHRLLAAGFHGEEPAGVWGMLAFLQNNQPEHFEHLCLSFLPLINTRGFSYGQRFNSQNRDVNRGYLVQHILTNEGQILMNNAVLLRRAAADGALTSHEDVTSQRGYVYTYEQHAEPGQFSRALRDVMGQHFPLETASMADGYPCQDAIIFNQTDDSFESWLFAQGVPRVACTETPGQCDFDARVVANAALIKHFIEIPAAD